MCPRGSGAHHLCMVPYIQDADRMLPLTSYDATKFLVDERIADLRSSASRRRPGRSPGRAVWRRGGRRAH